MKSTGIIRYIGDLGTVVIPKEIRNTFHLEIGEPLEIYTNKQGEIILKKYKKSWEQHAIDFYNSHSHIFQDKTATYAFYHHGHYTVCFINSCGVKNSRIGTAKRHTKDSHDYRIGKVAAYARAIGQPLNELIGYKGK